MQKTHPHLDETKIINLTSKQTASDEILKTLKAMVVKDLVYFESNYDFSKELISVMKTNLSDIPFKAVFIEEGPKTWKIKVKYPSEDGGCCGSCG